MGGGETGGACVRGPDDGGGAGGHQAAAAGLLHVPEPGRGLRARGPAGRHRPAEAAGQRGSGAGPLAAAAHPHDQEVSDSATVVGSVLYCHPIASGVGPLAAVAMNAPEIQRSPSGLI